MNSQDRLPSSRLHFIQRLYNALPHIGASYYSVNALPHIGASYYSVLGVVASTYWSTVRTGTYRMRGCRLAVPFLRGLT